MNPDIVGNTYGLTRAQLYICDDLLERDTRPKGEIRSELTGSVHLCFILLHSEN